jgi:hypothetical protein
MKYRRTFCNDPEALRICGTLWGFQPVDLRKKYFKCINCKKPHLVKVGVIK